jgi:HSP20 family molecular chaperone IbpA
MAFMQTVGNGQQRSPHASVREQSGEYVIELEVAGFTESELVVEAYGRRLTVRGDQVETAEDDGKAFRLRERLEESFLLPDDAEVGETKVFFKHRTLEIHTPRTQVERRLLSIERPSYVFNPNAEPC